MSANLHFSRRADRAADAMRSTALSGRSALLLGAIAALVALALVTADAAHAQSAASAAADANRAIQAAPAPESSAIVNTVRSSGRAPTVEALSNAQRLEIDAEVRKRMTSALTPPSSGAAASAPAAPTVISYPIVRTERAPPPDTTKTVLAIYGPVGQEVADIRLPNGSVMTARAGTNVQGYQVLRITAQSAELAVPAGNNTASKRHHGVPNGKRAPARTDLVAGATIRVAVGSTFK